MDAAQRALELLPAKFSTEFIRRVDKNSLEEIRLRTGRPLALIAGGGEEFFHSCICSEADIRWVLEKASSASLHTVSAELARGFISCGGLRIGVCGTAVISQGEIRGFRNYSSLSMRIPHERMGICDGLYKELYSDGFENTLILSPPGGGKTTAIRELVRKLSEAGMRVSLVDERNEIAASLGAAAGFDVGRSTDVLTGMDKSGAAMQLLRSMNPQLIAMDEISQSQDMAAIREIIGCGVHLLASAHASGVNDLHGRQLYRQLLDEKIFKWAVLISGSGKNRKYRAERLAE